ncbi:polysaccharide deacetylase family protein [Pseudodesulfovibrio senegalensis]|uniref:Polysaccharide deacetylase n=1 Tax=Pseudodesulfovibrio senegalensis TaxID=1721087 RepID=A0A6N6N1T2_9BACT|nr:polysaccharide deacetylase family protein [Pseudodesulfovibrio senegalensis]KAB1439059.1 hypothetical protein F8A88_14215 [Pseudodesulfovibrio senegalensis]
MTLDALAAIANELDAWRANERTATLWWRDDDAHAAGPELDRLLALCRAHNTPCSLAAIPARVEDSMVALLHGTPQAWVLQHGYAHVNHAPRGKGLGAWELGLHRPLQTVLDDLERGRTILKDRFKGRFVPAVVPPWNRIDPVLLRHFPALGLTGMSAEDRGPLSANRVRIVPAHADLLRWKGKAAHFAGAQRVTDQILDHLRSRRMKTVDPDTPTGVLTHHLEMDEAAWEFMNALLEATNAHTACRWLAAPDIFEQGNLE